MSHNAPYGSLANTLDQTTVEVDTTEGTGAWSDVTGNASSYTDIFTEQFASDLGLTNCQTTKNSGKGCVVGCTCNTANGWYPTAEETGSSDYVKVKSKARSYNYDANGTQLASAAPATCYHAVETYFEGDCPNNYFCMTLSPRYRAKNSGDEFDVYMDISTSMGSSGEEGAIVGSDIWLMDAFYKAQDGSAVLSRFDAIDAEYSAGKAYVTRRKMNLKVEPTYDNFKGLKLYMDINSYLFKGLGYDDKTYQTYELPTGAPAGKPSSSWDNHARRTINVGTDMEYGCNGSWIKPFSSPNQYTAYCDDLVEELVAPLSVKSLSGETKTYNNLRITINSPEKMAPCDTTKKWYDSDSECMAAGYSGCVENQLTGCYAPSCESLMGYYNTKTECEAEYGKSGCAPYNTGLSTGTCYRPNYFGLTIEGWVDCEKSTSNQAGMLIDGQDHYVVKITLPDGSEQTVTQDDDSDKPIKWMQGTYKLQVTTLSDAGVADAADIQYFKIDDYSLMTENGSYTNKNNPYVSNIANYITDGVSVCAGCDGCTRSNTGVCKDSSGNRTFTGDCANRVDCLSMNHNFLGMSYGVIVYGVCR